MTVSLLFSSGYFFALSPTKQVVGYFLTIKFAGQIIINCLLSPVKANWFLFPRFAAITKTENVSKTETAFPHNVKMVNLTHQNINSPSKCNISDFNQFVVAAKFKFRQSEELLRVSRIRNNWQNNFRDKG